MNNPLFYDAAFPPKEPPETQGFFFYIGGDADHIWTTEEINAQTATLAFPIWVRSNPASVSPVADAAACVEALRAYDVPEGKAVFVDIETAVDSSWTVEFSKLVNHSNYVVVLYGSRGTLFRNQLFGPGYYWIADYTNEPHIFPGTIGTQYETTAGYDLSDMQEEFAYTHAIIRVPPAETKTEEKTEAPAEEKTEAPADATTVEPE